MTATQYRNVMAELAIIKEQTKPKTIAEASEASIHGFQGGDKPYIAPPAPEKKIYADALAQYGAKGNTPEEKLALLAKRIRERKPGYPESSQGIVGQWDTYPWVQPFIDDNPGLFNK